MTLIFLFLIAFVAVLFVGPVLLVILAGADIGEKESTP